jgi:hypothetical protein
MILSFPCLLAAPDENIPLIILSFYGPFWLAVLGITAIVLTLRHGRKLRELELGSQMIHDMLGRKMTPEEIQRVLIAWSGRRKQLKELVRQLESDNSPAPFNGKPAIGKPPLGKPPLVQV